MPSFDRRHVALSLIAASFAAVSLVVLDAARQRASSSTRDQELDEIAARLPGPDLAVAVGARHLRAPSLEEPAAAFQDAPASPDLDPAGGAIAPPRAVWTQQMLQRSPSSPSSP